MRRRIGIFGIVVLLLTASIRAQVGGIAGVVTDESKAVLPGVTIRVTSPALIEKTRSTVTDAEGRYRLTDLPVGTYEVTFFLQGFTTVKRAGVVVTSDFTARVDAEMKVSGIVQAVAVIAEVSVVGACGIAPPGHWLVQSPAGGWSVTPATILRAQRR
jgi:hypothetical protein